MGRKKICDPEEVCRQIIRARGNMTMAAFALGVTTQSVSNWIANNPEIKKAYDTANEILLDVAEAELVRHMKNRKNAKGDLRAIQFFLTNKGRHRGWGQLVTDMDNGQLAEYAKVIKDHNTRIALGLTYQPSIDAKAEEKGMLGEEDTDPIDISVVEENDDDDGVED